MAKLVMGYALTIEEKIGVYFAKYDRLVTCALSHDIMIKRTSCGGFECTCTSIDGWAHMWSKNFAPNIDRCELVCSFYNSKKTLTSADIKRLNVAICSAIIEQLDRAL